MEASEFAIYLKKIEVMFNQAEREMGVETLRCFLQATEQKVAQLKWLWLE